MCEKDKCCQKPDQLKGKPRDCSLEQIMKCHGDVNEHPCVPKVKSSIKKENKK